MLNSAYCEWKSASAVSKAKFKTWKLSENVAHDETSYRRSGFGRHTY
jgi:hypothetical protein